MAAFPAPTCVHADPALRVVVDSGALPWHPSPLAGVERRLLERDGGEVARATSLVRYAPGRRFSPHHHGGGEEFLVLEGVFSDEHGDYGPGTYVRNPVGSAHAPFSAAGCTILVKLRQMDPGDQTRVVIDTGRATFVPGLVPGLSVLPLHGFGLEHVALVRWEPGTRFPLHAHPGGEEIFVLEGVFEDEQGAYPAGTWLRNPAASRHAPFSGSGCLIWVKTGHLAPSIPAMGPRPGQ
jgi:anti-sigma factor ChrR (cupin superfamily)